MQASKGKVALLKKLIQSAANVKAKDNTGSTSLHRSKLCSHPSSAQVTSITVPHIQCAYNA